MNKRSVTIAGHRTSISLEEPFWEALRDLARADGRSLAAVVADLDGKRRPTESLSSAIRVHVLASYRGHSPPKRPARRA